MIGLPENLKKRVNKFLDDEDHQNPQSFFVMTKRLLEKTFYEVFEVRGIMKRRKPDILLANSDRVFLIKQGCAWFVRDIQKQVKHLKFSRIETQPKLLQISKQSFAQNPAFNKLLGLVPASPVNDIMNIMPGIFVIGGIFGTFLGIMKALPELGGMNLDNPEQAKMIMDQFLLKIAFSMNTSLLGIILSVSLSFFNTALSPEKVFSDVIDRFEATLDLLWHRATSNDLPAQINKFDENRDPLEALAEESIFQELKNGSKRSPADKKTSFLRV